LFVATTYCLSKAEEIVLFARLRAACKLFVFSPLLFFVNLSREAKCPSHETTRLARLGVLPILARITFFLWFSCSRSPDMKNRSLTNRSILFAMLTAAAAFAYAAPVAHAQTAPKKDQHSHGADGHSHGAPAKMPKTYAKAVAEMADRANEVEAALHKGDLDKAHDEADVIAAIAKSLGALALKADSGVKRAKVKEANTTGKAIAEQMNLIHDAADTKDIAAAKAAFAKGKTLLDSLSAAAQFLVEVKPVGGTIVVGKQIVQVPITVESITTTVPAKCALVVDAVKPKTVDGYIVTLNMTSKEGGPIKTGAATHMKYTIMKDGKPMTNLQPYLGAMGHLIISSDLKEFVHSHPHEEGAEYAAASKSGPNVDFEATFKAPGIYKA